MKKTLLCFLFLFTNLFYAQVNDIEHCAGDTSFDLTFRKTELIGNLNPAETIVTYHLSLDDANNNTNVIANPANYVSNAASKTIYARIDNKGAITKNYFNLILKPALQSFVTATPLDCIKGTSIITVVASGGKLPYSYSLNGQPFAPTNTFANLTPGAYAILTKDGLNCLTNIVIVIQDIIPIAISYVRTNVSCQGSNDGSIVLATSGGNGPITYTLKNQSGAILANNTQANIFSNLSAGSYTVEAKDSAGCTTMINASILEPGMLIATATIENQTITVNVTGGSGSYMYAISPNLNQFYTENIFSNLTPGIYSVVILDENGCSLIKEISINPPSPLINGKNTLTVEFTPGQTLADIVVDGQNIKWYDSQNSTGKTNKATETTLPSNTILVDGTTYYASQTINNVESKQRLAVTAKSNGTLFNDDFVLPNFKFYPNPVKNKLALSNTANIDEVEIFSVSGKSILVKKINNVHSEIDLSNISTGIYFLKVQSEGKTKTIKIVKE